LPIGGEGRGGEEECFGKFGLIATLNISNAIANNLVCMEKYFNAVK
jgi:hypothetical protein